MPFPGKNWSSNNDPPQSRPWPNMPNMPNMPSLSTVQTAFQAPKPASPRPTFNPFSNRAGDEPHTSEPRPSAPMSASRSKRMGMGGGRPPLRGGVDRDWSTDMYDCIDPCDWNSCFQSTFCPCVVYGNNKRRFDHLQTKGHAHPALAPSRRDPSKPSTSWWAQLDGSAHHGNNASPDGQPQAEDESDFFSIPCFMHAVVAPIGGGIVFQTINRNKMRERYRIKGTWFGDFFGSLCCGPCQLVQESKELETEEGSFTLPHVVDVQPRPRRMHRI